MNETDYDELVFALRHDYDLADSTVKSYENAILPSLDETLDADWPSEVDRTTVDDQGPTADDILDPAEVRQLTESADHQRDVVFIEFLADTGARLSVGWHSRCASATST
jgi:hypothetical protein